MIVAGFGTKLSRDQSRLLQSQPKARSLAWAHGVRPVTFSTLTRWSTCGYFFKLSRDGNKPELKKSFKFSRQQRGKKNRHKQKQKLQKFGFLFIWEFPSGYFCLSFSLFPKSGVFFVCWWTKKTDSAFSTPFLLRSNIRLSNKLMFFPAGFLHSLLFIFITDERERERERGFALIGCGLNKSSCFGTPRTFPERRRLNSIHVRFE